jgi:hypothetical protein
MRTQRVSFEALIPGDIVLLQPGGRVIDLVGAVERLLDRCAHALGENSAPDPLDKNAVQRTVERWPNAAFAASPSPTATSTAATPKSTSTTSPTPA